MSKAFWIARAEQAMRQLEKYEKYGEDDYEDGAVIIFEYQFTPSGQAYSYAALKAHGKWYTTGPRSPKAYTWEELVSWFAEASNDVEVYVVTNAARVV